MPQSANRLHTPSFTAGNYSGSDTSSLENRPYQTHDVSRERQELSLDGLPTLRRKEAVSDLRSAYREREKFISRLRRVKGDANLRRLHSSEITTWSGQQESNISQTVQDLRIEKNIHTVRTSRSGERVLSVETLSESQKSAYLNEYDPVRKYGLDNDSVLYRAIEKERLNDSRISGNPNSVARISNYFAPIGHPIRAQFEALLTSPDVDETMRLALQETLVRMPNYVVAPMYANDLKEPSLNVMYGDDALSGARDYAKDGMIVVKMKLGDFRKQDGGTGFLDTGALKSNPKSVPLIVTLPTGRWVPVQLVE